MRLMSRVLSDCWATFGGPFLLLSVAVGPLQFVFTFILCSRV